MRQLQIFFAVSGKVLSSVDTKLAGSGVDSVLAQPFSQGGSRNPQRLCSG